MDIQPGNTVTIRVTARIDKPTAQKTLARLFLKDPAIASSRLRSPKQIFPRRRAGRPFNRSAQGSVARIPSIGDTATVLATVDVVNDLKSVQKYIAIN